MSAFSPLTVTTRLAASSAAKEKPLVMRSSGAGRDSVEASLGNSLTRAASQSPPPVPTAAVKRRPTGVSPDSALSSAPSTVSPASTPASPLRGLPRRSLTSDSLPYITPTSRSPASPSPLRVGAQGSDVARSATPEVTWDWFATGSPLRTTTDLQHGLDQESEAAPIVLPPRQFTGGTGVAPR